MSKLAAQDKFLDLSDYGRPFGKFLANLLKNTRFTPIHVTLLFGVSGLIAIYCILVNQYLLAGFFIVLKSGIDAADGELARLKNRPSYTGRYLDSVFDIILNFHLLSKKYYVMNENKLMQQIGTMFGVVMTFFYIGVGIYLIFFFTYYDKFIRILLGSTFIFYGIYRGYRTYVKIIEIFFPGDKSESEKY